MNERITTTMSELMYPDTISVNADLRRPGARTYAHSYDTGSAVASPMAAYPSHASHVPRDMAVFMKDNKGLCRVLIRDLMFLVADGNYVEVHLRNRRVVLRNSMSEILKSLPENIFFMVNRSQAVNILLLENITADEVTLGDRSFTLTKRYRDELLRELNIITGR